MKTILCYGDSNTWGLNYESQKRFPFAERWPNVMQQQLGCGFHVIEEGLNGRTTSFDDIDDEWKEAKNGRKYLVPCLRSHFPLDLVIIMLGTNDLKVKFFTSVSDISKRIGILIKLTLKELQTRQKYEPKILLAAPMAIGDTIDSSVFKEVFGGKEAIAPSIKLAEELRKTAEDYSCYFLNAADIAKPNPMDAIHFSTEGHKQFGIAAALKVQQIFEGKL